MRYLAMCALALLGGCDGDLMQGACIPVVTEVPCAVRKGTLLGDRPADSDEVGGPLVCKRSLELWFHGHPNQRVIAAVPLERPIKQALEPPQRQNPGTQALLILHSRTGSAWPRAADLEVDSKPCAALDERGMVHEVGPQYCTASLERDAKSGADQKPPPLFLISVTSYLSNEANPGTQEIIWVSRK